MHFDPILKKLRVLTNKNSIANIYPIVIDHQVWHQVQEVQLKEIQLSKLEAGNCLKE